MKHVDKEIVEIGKMLTATKSEDISRLKALRSRLGEIIDGVAGQRPRDDKGYSECEEAVGNGETVGVDKFHYHEMLDRLHIVNDMIGGHIQGHPVYEKHPELKEEVDKAFDILIRAYNMSSGLGRS